MPRIELINVSKRWGNFIGVDHLNMVIEDNEFITLLGPSGCGKTTTLRMIAGLETPTEGKIIIGDTVVFDSESGINISPAKRDIGFLFQNYALWPHMTVYKNIAFGLENLKWKKEDIAARVDEVCRMLKVEQFKDRYPAELSGGQQQRVAIARTLAPRPKVLFMDEPLSNLDAKLRGEMRTELKRLHNDTGSTFVYVTHDQLEAMTLATRICLIETGVLQQYDPPLTVYNEPANLFVADFVGNPTMNFIESKAEKVDDNTIKVNLCGIPAIFHAIDKVEFSAPVVEPAPEAAPVEGEAPVEAPAEPAVSEVVIGIRPEFLDINPNGAIEGKAFAALPAGMETTVRISLGESLLSAVKFGAVNYEADEIIRFDISGNGIILFDKASRKKLTLGSVEIVK